MDLNNILFTELVFKYNLTKDLLYKNEIVRRLKFCNFDEKCINYIIKLELNIIKKRKLFFEKNMMNLFSWTNFITYYKNDINFKLFNMPLEKYAQVDNHEVLNSTLTLGEIAILYADAQILSEFQDIFDIPQNMKNEINNFAIDKKNCISNLKLIYNGKFDLVYMMDNDCYPGREFYILCSRFFRNEAQIVFNYKWFNENFLNSNNEMISFIPYTIDYFRFFEIK